MDNPSSIVPSFTLGDTKISVCYREWDEPEDDTVVPAGMILWITAW